MVQNVVPSLATRWQTIHTKYVRLERQVLGTFSLYPIHYEFFLITASSRNEQTHQEVKPFAPPRVFINSLGTQVLELMKPAGV